MLLLIALELIELKHQNSILGQSGMNVQGKSGMTVQVKLAAACRPPPDLPHSSCSASETSDTSGAQNVGAIAPPSRCLDSAISHRPAVLACCGKVAFESGKVSTKGEEIRELKHQLLNILRPTLPYFMVHHAAVYCSGAF